MPQFFLQKDLNYYVEGRVFEWVMGLSTFFAGMEYWFWPEVIKDSSFHYLTSYIPHELLLFILIVLGWSRCSALMLNGQTMFGVRMGSYIRAACGVISGVLWAQISVALLLLSFDRGLPSPGLPFWVMFSFGEVYAAYTTVKNG